MLIWLKKVEHYKSKTKFFEITYENRKNGKNNHKIS